MKWHILLFLVEQVLSKELGNRGFFYLMLKASAFFGSLIPQSKNTGFHPFRLFMTKNPSEYFADRQKVSTFAANCVVEGVTNSDIRKFLILYSK